MISQADPAPLPADFDRNCFINCPFDTAYMPLLRPILFCVLALGLTPRIALETLNSGRPRIEKIVGLILESRYAIHDLSRLKAEAAGEFFRLNMPFELGLDVGCRLFKPGIWSAKTCLILEAEPYRFKAALSDLANSDIAAHGNDPIRALAEVRNWLATEVPVPAALGATGVWDRFIDFTADHHAALSARAYSPADIQSQSIAELIPAMRDWLASNHGTGAASPARPAGTRVQLPR